ncbi:hypothetical protein [Rhodovulum sulfidophilum]|uniref:hypothetical protein n=1 Tax=Rhodovulum sulfidophilum TaxID=35806 RepID=UPI001389FE1F|nr:hypothetical protein [Rhodovulum sulfidophilum]NDK33617.1 hypothetical protein [Rhodovulum sulfidophilum]
MAGPGIAGMPVVSLGYSVLLRAGTWCQTRSRLWMAAFLTAVWPIRMVWAIEGDRITTLSALR